MQVTVEQIVQWIKNIDEKMNQHKTYLTSLDRPIGDGDHGMNMATGFHIAAHVISNRSFQTVAEVLKTCATTVVSNVGGAAGPLYGTAFLRMALFVKGNEPVSVSAFSDALAEALRGIKKRGQTDVGEKTMIDVWQPVVLYLKEEQNLESDFTTIGKEAMEKTKHIEAAKGRASYFKDDSIGYIDPGAASSYLLFEALAEVWSGGEKSEWSRDCINFS